ATVTPLTCAGARLLTRAACAGPIGAPVAAARTSDQECQWAFALIVPAIPAGAAARTTPATTAAAVLRSTPMGRQDSLRRMRGRRSPAADPTARPRRTGSGAPVRQPPTPSPKPR